MNCKSSLAVWIEKNVNKILFLSVKNIFIFLYYTTKKKLVADNTQISFFTSELCKNICLVWFARGVSFFKTTLLKNIFLELNI